MSTRVEEEQGSERASRRALESFKRGLVASSILSTWLWGEALAASTRQRTSMWYLRCRRQEDDEYDNQVPPVSERRGERND
jgi:hypothetical protein